LFIALTAFFSVAIVGALRYDLIEDTTAEQKLVLATVVKDEKLAAELREAVGEQEREMFERILEIERAFEDD
jgi:hypothetical protein